MSDQPHPRCAFAGCEMPGEAVRDMPCAYFCRGHMVLDPALRAAAFRRAVEAQEERERNAAP